MGGASPPLLDRVEAGLRASGCGRRLVVAVSGGVDSTVLLHALAELREPLGLELLAAHVNHGLRGGESEDDARFVAALAARFDVPFQCARVDPAAAQSNRSSRERPTLQEAARSARRRALVAIRDSHGFDQVATAHHADDQAETVLMRLLRGCGPDSLGGMGELSADGGFVRPLLGVARAEIEAAAARSGLSWREDRSNADPRYTRNRLRAQVLPALARDFNPRLLRAIGDLAEAQRRDTEWLNDLAREEGARLVVRDETGRLRISAAGWSERPEALARRIVRSWLLELGGGRDLSRVHLLRALRFLREGRPGTAIELPGSISLGRENADSFVLERASHLS